MKNWGDKIKKNQEVVKINNDSINFMKYYKRFENSQTLPFYFDTEYFFSNSNINIIPNAEVEKYICTDPNFCTRTLKSGNIIYSALSKVKIKEDFYTVLFSIQELTISQTRLVLANYSKKDYKLISKISLTGFTAKVKEPYELTSYINDSLFIKSTIRYKSLLEVSCVDTVCLPNAKYPNFFHVVEYISKYKINLDGTFTCLEDTKEKYIAKYTENGVELRVKLTNE